MYRSLCALLVFPVILGASPQTTGVFDAPAPPAPKADAQPYPVQKIGPGDTITLAVADLPELNRNFRITSSGDLMLPLLKERIPVAGKTTQEIEQAVSDALVREQILVSPVVSVSVAEFTSVPVTVLGAVRHPVTFQAVGDVHLLDAITRAEGINPDAGSDILVTHDGITQRIPAKQLIDEADPALNVRLYGGDEVRVPAAGEVFVLGNVRHSGAFPITDNGDASILKIVAESEGLLPFASKQAYIYRRDPGVTQRTEIAVPLREILERKAPDVQLHANDILYIPDDRHKRLTVGVIERAAGFGVATASGLLIFH